MHYGSDQPLADLLNKPETAGSIDGWMLTYLDVFVQMTAIFVVLFIMTHSQSEAVPEATQAKISTATSATKTMTTAPIPAPEFEPTLVATIENNTENRLTDLYNQVSRLAISEQIGVSIEDDSARLTIEDEILFDSAEAGLTPSGEDLLAELAPLVQDCQGIILIEGHTDDRPIHTADYPSNWVLAGARANSVVHFLVESGVNEKRLRAISYGDTRPVVPNTSASNRQKNRRVSIVLKPSQWIE
ncbi:MAG: hypothetical protein CSB48_08635 [Proteobacteria bacterium]|nr:MAG: hypothetical protein CSB48_08635 [Pseudomonadota bacterium]